MSMLPNEHLHILTLRHAPLFHSFSQTHTHILTASLPQAWVHTDLLVTHTSTCSPTGNFNNLSITLPASHNMWIHKEHSFIHFPHQHQIHTLHAASRNTIWLQMNFIVQDGVKNTFVVIKGKPHSVQFAWTWTLSTLQHRHKHFWSAQNNNEKLPWGA